MQGGINTEIIFPELSYKIVGILFDVYNELGPGLKEKHYQRAIEIAFNNKSIIHKRECPYTLTYQGQDIGEHQCQFG